MAATTVGFLHVLTRSILLDMIETRIAAPPIFLAYRLFLKPITLKDYSPLWLSAQAVGLSFFRISEIFPC